MTREELEMMLGEMDPEERELAIAADDAADRLWAYKLRKEFGVQEVVCNPDGDRTKVMIDGVVMDQEQFNEWYASKQLEKMTPDNDDEEPTVLPTDLEISYEELSRGGYVALPSDVKRYLRREFGYCLARDNSNMTIDIQDDDEMVYVHNIAWSRKLTTEELNNLR